MKLVQALLILALYFIFSVVIHQSVQPKDQFTAYVIIWGIAGVFALRQVPGFKWLWRHIAIFFGVLFGYVLVNYAKDEIKSWLKD